MMDNQEMIQDNGSKEVAAPQVHPELPRYVPPVDVHEDANAWTLYADMPGIDPDSLDVRFENEMLTLQARQLWRADERTSHELREFVPGEYVRSFRVTTAIDVSKIAAEYRDGVLVVTLPKSETSKARRIEVKTK